MPPLTGGVSTTGGGGGLGAALGSLFQQGVSTFGPIALDALASTVNGAGQPPLQGGTSQSVAAPPGGFVMGGGSVKVNLPSPPIAPYQPTPMAPVAPLQPQVFQPIPQMPQFESVAPPSYAPMQPMNIPSINAPGVGGAGQPLAYAPMIVEGDPSSYRVPATPAQQQPQGGSPIPTDPGLDEAYAYDQQHGPGAYERSRGLPPPNVSYGQPAQAPAPSNNPAKAAFDAQYGPGAYEKFQSSQLPQSQPGNNGKGFHMPGMPAVRNAAHGFWNRLGQGIHNGAIAASPRYSAWEMARQSGRSALQLEQLKQDAQLNREITIEKMKEKADALKQQGMNDTEIAKVVLKGSYDMKQADIAKALTEHQKLQALQDFLKLPIDTQQGQANRAAMVAQNPWLEAYMNTPQNPLAEAQLGKENAQHAREVLHQTEDVYTIYQRVMQEFYKTNDAARKDQIDQATVNSEIQKRVADGNLSQSRAQVAAGTVAADIQKTINDSGKSGYDMYNAGVQAQWAQPNAQQQYQGRQLQQAATANEIGQYQPSPDIPTLKQMGIINDQMTPQQQQQIANQYANAGASLQMQAGQQARRTLQGGATYNGMVPPPPPMMAPPPMPGAVPAGMMQQYPQYINQLPTAPPGGQYGGQPTQPQYNPAFGRPNPAPQPQQAPQAPPQQWSPPGPQRLVNNPIDFMLGNVPESAMTPDQIRGRREIEGIQNEWKQKEVEAKQKEEEKYLARVDALMTPQSRGLKKGAVLTDSELAWKFVTAAEQSVKRWNQLLNAAGWSGFKNTGAAQPLSPRFAQVQQQMQQTEREGHPFYAGDAPFPYGQLPQGPNKPNMFYAGQPPFPAGQLPPAMMGR